MRLKMSFEIDILPKDPHRIGLTIIKSLIKMSNKELYQKFYESNKHTVKPFTFFYKTDDKVLRVGPLTYTDKFLIYLSTNDESVRESIKKGFYIFKGIGKDISYKVTDKIQAGAKPVDLKEFSIPIANNIAKIPSFVIPELFIKKYSNKSIDDIITDYFKLAGIDIKVISSKMQSTYTNIHNADRQIRGFNLTFAILSDVNKAWDRLESGIGARKSQGFGYCMNIPKLAVNNINNIN